MSGRAQELFLAHAHFCSDGGVQPLVPIVREAVLQALDGVDLATPVEASRILQVFSDAHASECLVHILGAPWLSRTQYRQCPGSFCFTTNQQAAQQAARQALHIAASRCPNTSCLNSCQSRSDCWKDELEDLLGQSTASTVHAGNACW